ncbi:hypothetical protein AB0Y38_18205 [Lysinibacillus capsici]|uniref:hypothetical protein n=1 Tax=Lysinibacillus capsici TaxID=2115968 RepID=UPI003F259D0A
MVDSKTCSVLPLEKLRAIQCMRRLSLSRSIIDAYKFQNRVLKTFYYNVNHIEETTMDTQDKLIIDELVKSGIMVFHIFHSRGMVEFAPNHKDWMMRRAYVFINRISNDKNINSISHSEIGQGVLDAFVICEPIYGEVTKVLKNGVFSPIILSKINNLIGEEKIIWNIDGDDYYSLKINISCTEISTAYINNTEIIKLQNKEI